MSSHHPARVHGGLRSDELLALRLDPEQVLDFSVNTNPYGPCAAVAQAIQRARVDRYPDADAHEVRVAMARSFDQSPERIVLGPGAADLLWTAARALLGPGAHALVVEPTFCEFRAAALATGAEVHAFRTSEHTGFRVELEAVLEAALRCRARVIYLCAPNTPTGVALPAPEIAAVASLRPELTWVLDQSFLSLSERFTDAAVAMPDNVVRVRSLTKEHGIPGIRVGYALAHPTLARRMLAQGPSWNTGAHAQAAALAACSVPSFVARSRDRLLADCARMSAELASRGLAPLPSTTAFFMVRVRDASELRSRLLAQHAILVRDCASFGLPDFIRLAARPAADSARLCAALAAEVSC
jgi:histidinol-phosphate/aromatic aminotransferase/cobyric acid decarboxylase-like protein